MKNLRTSVVLVLYMITVYSCTNSQSKKNGAETYIPVKFDRIFKDVQFEKKGITFDNGFELLAPMSIKYHDKRFYIADNIKGKVYVFNESFALVDSIVQREGRGPGELLHIVDFEVNNDFVFIVDGRNLSINKFTAEGAFITSRKLKKIPSRLTFNNEDIVILNTSPGDLFTLIDTENLEVKREAALSIANEGVNFMTIFGHLEPREEGGFIYIPMHQSTLYYLNENIEIDFIINRPDGLNFPLTNNNLSNGERRAPVSEVPVFETSYFDDKLYVGNYLKDFGEKGEDIMDVFNYSTGVYLFSFVMPFGCVDFIVRETSFVCLERGERLSIYKMDFK